MASSGVRLVPMDEREARRTRRSLDRYDAAPPLDVLRERIAEVLSEYGSLTAQAAIGNGHWPSIDGALDAVLRVVVGDVGETQ